MLTALAPIMVLVLLSFALVSLFALTSAIQRARARVVERQIRLTDAIHAELGAVVSPVVEKRALGAWTVSFTAPLERSSMVGRLLSITDRVLRAEAGTGESVHIVITPQPCVRHERVAWDR